MLLPAHVDLTSSVLSVRLRKQRLLMDLQAFNRGLFDFLIATDDPTKQAADKPTSAEAGAAAAASAAPADGQQPVAPDGTASISQQPGAATNPTVDGEEDDAVPDHAWTEAAATALATQVGDVTICNHTKNSAKFARLNQQQQ